jgi:hypothetical protein
VNRDAIHAALDMILDALAERSTSQPTDELVPLRELPFDVEARRRLVREGKLKTVRIGRSLFTSRAAVAALATELPPATMPGPKPRAALAPVDDVAEAARRRAARKAAR